MQRTRRVAVVAVCTAVVLCATAGQALAAKPALKITKVQVTTAGHRTSTVSSGAPVRSCSSDPIYAVTFFYKWSHMKVPGTERLRLDAPGHPDTSKPSKLFEEHGNNADLATAEQFDINSTSLPAGAYRFKATLDGLTVKSAVTIEDASC